MAVDFAVSIGLFFRLNSWHGVSVVMLIDVVLWNGDVGNSARWADPLTAI